jgi:hypothetical protein
LILPGTVSKQPVARFHTEGHLRAWNHSADHKEMREKMIENIRTRNFVFRQ